MTAKESPRKFPRVWLEVLVALALIGAGLYSLWSVTAQHPYLGEPLPSGANVLVPYRVLATPNVPAIVLFLASAFSAITGAAWFILRLIHQLFFKPVRASRVWREAILIAVFVVSLAWLQVNQAFSLVVAAVIAAALILLEVFLNIREHNE